MALARKTRQSAKSRIKATTMPTVINHVAAAA